MTFSFKAHQEGCTPFSPCQSCNIVALLRSNLTAEQFSEFTNTVDADNFSFTEHQEGCTPATPCKNCARMAWLRTTLGVPKYSDLVFSLTGERPIDPEAARRLQMSVEELNLSVRTSAGLRNSNIKTVGELVQQTEAELLRTPNFGRRSLNELKEQLGRIGLHLKPYR